MANRIHETRHFDLKSKSRFRNVPPARFAPTTSTSLYLLINSPSVPAAEASELQPLQSGTRCHLISGHLLPLPSFRPHLKPNFFKCVFLDPFTFAALNHFGDCVRVTNDALHYMDSIVLNAKFKTIRFHYINCKKAQHYCLHAACQALNIF